MRVIGLTYWISSLLQIIRNRLILAIIGIRLSWLALISMLVDHLRPPWASSLMEDMVIYMGGVGTPGPYIR
jgi:hypothetical protein